jgi:hypothetical protein
MSVWLSAGVCLYMLTACNSQTSRSHSRADAPIERAPGRQPDNLEPSKFPPAHETATPERENSAPQSQARAAENAAATDVLRGYYAALEARDFKAAYAAWSDHGKASKQSFAAFQAGFASTRTTRVTVDQPGEIEGAAGSLYISIPVTVHAERVDGTSQTFSGSYVLRRVNDVEGSSADDRRWHIHSASLRNAE